MIRLTRKTEYALIALQYILRRPEGGRASAREIASACAIPEVLAAKILQELRHADLVTSTRGAAGGYAIAGDLRSRSFLDFLKLFEEHTSLVVCAGTEACEKMGMCGIQGAMLAVNDTIAESLNSLTLYQILAEHGPPRQPMSRVGAPASERV